MSGHNFEKTAARSHERSNETKGKFEPQSLAKAPGSPVKDEARRARMTADAKRDYQDSVMRNERIAAQMKAASDKLWNRSA